MTQKKTISEKLALLRGKLFTMRVRIFKKNFIIGDGLKLYCKLLLSGKGKIFIGNNCTVKALPGSRTQYVTLGSLSPDAELIIGNNVQLLAAKISCVYSISIGNDAVIEDSSLMDSDFHSLDINRGKPLNENKKNCTVTIGDRVAIGAQCYVTKGVKLGDGALVAPCSVVKSSFPKESFLYGNPARQKEG
jgi:acetyltransferase-like isoleucine patch superfamily enzyme